MSSTVNSLWKSGHYIGSALSSFCIFSIKGFGWRWTFNAMGLAGILLGLCIFVFVKEPRREKSFEDIKKPNQEII